MFIFQGTCPHCHSDRGFMAFGMSHYVVGDYDYSKTPATDRNILEKRRENNPLLNFSLAGSCLSCKKPVVATCSASQKIFEDIRPCIGALEKETHRQVTVEHIFPSPMQHYSHPSMPEKVNESFVDLQKMLVEKKQPHFIIFGCRSVLEAAIRHLGGEGKSLHAKVEDLYAKGMITASLKDWASIIRRTGNEAAHEMKGTSEEARELVDFTRIFLQFTFELPDTISKARSAHRQV